MQESKKQYIFLAFRFLIGGTFLYAGVEKILSPFDFAAAIYNYRIFPGPLIGIAAAVVPWVEALAGLCLLTGFNAKGAATITSLLLLTFVGLIIISAVRGLDIDCGCFASVERKVGAQAILEDAALFIISASILFWETNVLNLRHLINKILPRRIEE
jgi:putative oxidoreductase